jgi:hypothetical protein
MNIFERWWKSVWARIKELLAGGGGNPGGGDGPPPAPTPIPTPDPSPAAYPFEGAACRLGPQTRDVRGWKEVCALKNLRLAGSDVRWEIEPVPAWPVKTEGDGGKLYGVIVGMQELEVGGGYWQGTLDYVRPPSGGGTLRQLQRNVLDRFPGNGRKWICTATLRARTGGNTPEERSGWGELG